MRVRVLGSAAGGGLPQWNCGCDNCELVRRGDPRIVARTEDSLLVRGDTGHGDAGHLLVNASPSVLRQIERTEALWPRARRGTGISAIVLTNGDLDHVLGLFSLRESQPLVVYATERVWRGLMENAMMRTLARFEGQVRHERIVLGEARDVPEVGVTMRAFAAPGKPPVHLPGAPHDEDNIGLRIGPLAIATSARDVSEIREHIAGARVTFVDGTFFSSDELVSQNLSRARAEDMAHQPLDRSMALLAKMDVGRKILTHINNTNPILRADSRERARATEMGFEIAHDGMEVEA